MRCYCSFYIGAKNPKISGDGPLDALDLIVGESPGAEEDKLGRCFVGPTGALLRATTRRAKEGTSLEIIERYTNAIRCFPLYANKSLALAPCRKFLLDEIAAVKPRRIIALGALAAESLLGEDVSVTQIAGGWRRETFGDIHVPVQVQIHPAAALRNASLRPEWQRQYTEALTHLPPDTWRDQIELCVETCRTVDEAVRRLELALSSRLVAFDTEYNPSSGHFLCLAVATDANTAFVIHADVARDPRVVGALTALFEDPGVGCAAHNWKFDAHVAAETFGIDQRVFSSKVWFDTMTLARIDNAERSASLETVEWLVGLGGHKEAFYDKLPSKNGNGYEKLWKADPDLVGEYCGVDAIACWRLVPLLANSLNRRGLFGAWRESVGVVGPVLFDMECSGIKVDRSGLGALGVALEQRKALELAAVRSSHAVARLAAAGSIPSADVFNPNSQPHMRALMFSSEGLGLNPSAMTSGGKSGKAKPKVDKNTRLEHSDSHPVLQHINEHAKLEKLWNTYVKGWLSRLESDDTLHTSYSQGGARTFRLSSKDPNLQTVPRGSDPEKRDLRSLVTTFSEDEILLKIDYSQVELRVLAMESRDPELLRCYRDRVDVHRRTAAAILGIAPEDVDKKARQAAKPINFGVIFGMREVGLVDYAKHDYGVDMTLEEAREALSAYFALYRGVPVYQMKLIAEARRTGFVWINWDGKPFLCRPVPDIGSNDRSRVGAAERVIRNTPIQGGAAQYTSHALIELHRLFHLGELPGVVGLVATVHDDIWFRVRRGCEEEAFRAIGCVMTSFPTVGGVPLEVEGECGSDLGHMTNLGVINSLDNPEMPPVKRLVLRG